MLYKMLGSFPRYLFHSNFPQIVPTKKAVRGGTLKSKSRQPSSGKASDGSTTHRVGGIWDHCFRSYPMFMLDSSSLGPSHDTGNGPVTSNLSGQKLDL